MAATKQSSTVLWSTATTKSLATTSWFVSDEFTLDDQDWSILLTMIADNSGTPASGDTVEVRLLIPDGSGNYPSVNTSGTDGAQANFLALLDTYTNRDPDNTSKEIPIAEGKFKIAARAAQGATRAITFSAIVSTLRGPLA